MKKYEVLLSRTYIVEIQAEDEEKACRSVEFYLGDCGDLSTKEHRRSDNFLIEKIEPAINDAFEVTEIVVDEK